MNRAFKTHEFRAKYPGKVETVLAPDSYAVSCQFNRHGTLLAVGCNDGKLIIYDFLTKGEAKSVQVHTHPICSMSWSRNGRLILSASTDNTVCVTEIEIGLVHMAQRYPSPVMTVQFHPRDDRKALAVPMRPGPILFVIDNFERFEHHVLNREEDAHDLHAGAMAASFNRRGSRIFTGNSKGLILVTETETRRRIASFQIVSGIANPIIRQIEFARKGTKFMVNVSDRIIRVYNEEDIVRMGFNRVPNPQPEQKLQDIVNRHTWRRIVFSPDGSYICAGSQRHYQLVVWERTRVRLAKVLEGNRGDFLLDLQWHPLDPVICSVASGVVLVWGQQDEQNWAAFAPNFNVLHANVEYQEPEGEFDEEDEDKSEDEEENAAEEEEEEIDVTSITPNPDLLSSDEEEEDPTALTFLTVRPEWDNPEDDPNTPVEDPTTNALDVQNVAFDEEIADQTHPLTSILPRMPKQHKDSSDEPSSSKTAKKRKLK